MKEDPPRLKRDGISRRCIEEGKRKFQERKSKRGKNGLSNIKGQVAF